MLWKIRLGHLTIQVWSKDGQVFIPCLYFLGLPRTSLEKFFSNKQKWTKTNDHFCWISEKGLDFIYNEAVLYFQPLSPSIKLLIYKLFLKCVLGQKYCFESAFRLVYVVFGSVFCHLPHVMCNLHSKAPPYS